MIHLIGPGGAGKTTTGAALAGRLGARFADLDAEFVSRHGDISAFLDEHGYAAYASANVRIFGNLDGGSDRTDILALSSGFMTYADDVHPAYPAWRRRLASSPSTFVLLPSLQFDARQRDGSAPTGASLFPLGGTRRTCHSRTISCLSGLPARKIATLRPVETVVEELISALVSAGLRIGQDSVGAASRG